MLEILDKLYNENIIKKEEIIYLIDNIKPEQYSVLFKYARNTRERYYKKSVFMRGLIEFSNICTRDCLYCGIRRSNTEVERYRLSIDEILECCKEGYDLGYRTFVLQSGEDPWYTKEKISNLILKIKEKYKDVAVTLSIGERPEDEYRCFFEAGADRFLLRHETASKKLYQKLHPGMSFDNRRKCLLRLKNIGYQVGAGFMTGLPEQTTEDLADDLLFLHDLNPDMVGIGPFIPHSNTPLKDETGGSLDITLIILAIVRLLLPMCLLPSTTALGTIHPNGREMALGAGANVVMPNLTPTRVRAKYQLYENKICIGDEAAHCRKCIEKKIESTGYWVDMERGDSYEYNNNKHK